MEENQLSQMTSWHLSTRFESPLCLGPPPCGTQQDSESSPGVQPACEALLRRRLRSPAQRQLRQQGDKDRRSPGNLHRRLPGSSPQYRKPSMTNTFNNDPAPRKNHRGMISLVEAHFYASDTKLQTCCKIKYHGFIQFYQVTKHKEKKNGSLFTQEECGGVAVTVAVCLLIGLQKNGN